MKRLLAVGFLLVASPAFSLDYFGDISANDLLLAVTQDVYSPETQQKHQFEYRIELIDGVPIMTRTSPAPLKPLAGTMEIVRLAVVDAKGKRYGERAELVLTFTSGGWSQDKSKTVFRIPYSASTDDPLGMLNISEAGTMESKAWDPKNQSVAVTTGQSYPIQCKVLKNSLGFGNKLHLKR